MPYPSDLNDTEWLLVEDLFAVGNYGTSRKHEVRALLNAVFYLTKTGCQWQFLPNDFPPYSTVHSFFHRAKKRGIWEQMLQRLVSKSRIAQGRTPEPTFSLIDSQSVKTTGAANNRGIDGGKKDKRAQASYCH
jgi:putative transposase